ncbi:MAG: hybrid sensor histidine kinase/response regulator [Polyangiaceae bacterium]
MNGDASPSIADILRELEEAKGAHQQAVLEADRQRQINASLEEAVQSRDAILSVVAHDLRNPVNIISLAAHMLLDQVREPAARRSVERIVRSARRADRMLRDLLAISAMETGRFALETRPVETAELVLGALESQHSLAGAASVIVAADVSPGLPPLKADEDRLLDVLENLIGNAVKFTDPGGSISVGASAREDDVLLWVRDSGSGISAEQLPHIFDRFWQAKRNERRGVGLGLSICKGIVEAHGGQIWAESEVGVGTTMFFSIPAVRISASAVAKALPPDVVNILLVDDRPENLLSLRAILDRPDYRLVTARSGEEALALALRENFAVALLDIAMPGMSGLDVAVHLKDLERSRDIPIIFVTAFGNDPEEVHRAYSAGGADYLVKPLDAEIVRKKVAVFVDLSRRHQRAGMPPQT